jgi:hypothetical protein
MPGLALAIPAPMEAVRISVYELQLLAPELRRSKHEVNYTLSSNDVKSA